LVFLTAWLEMVVRIIADENIPFVADCFSSIGRVEVVPSREIKPNIVADADALLVRTVTPVGPDLLAGSSVRFVGTVTIGFDHIDVEYLVRNNIGFASAPGSNANSVAEYVIAALLDVAQKCDFDLQDKSIGIIGVGNCGSRVAKKAKALGMKLYFNDPPLQRQTGEAKYLPIENLFDCDIITFHTPLTFEGIDKTFHLADEKFFKSLKDGCVFVNTSRGGVVDSSALKAAITSGKLKAVVLDVWENEPNIDTVLLGMVDIATPHIAGYSLDGKVAGMIMVYRSACAHFGLEAKFDAESFLPEPAVSRLEINPQLAAEQQLLAAVVEKVYNIGDDDSRLRQILDKEKKGMIFDRLRNDYPVRREFQNTQIVLEDPCETLAKKLAGIGFKVTDE